MCGWSIDAVKVLLAGLTTVMIPTRSYLNLTIPQNFVCSKKILEVWIPERKELSGSKFDKYRGFYIDT